MIQYRKDICTCHNDKRMIVKRIAERKYCVEGNRERLEQRKAANGASPTKKRYRRKVTGERAFFEAIWASRPHVSFVSGVKLGDDFNIMRFFHVLGKGAYNRFRLYDKNLVLTTTNEHWNWHNRLRIELLEMDKGWQKVFDLEQELKQEYIEK